jgi:hypothetical protein
MCLDGSLLARTTQLIFVSGPATAGVEHEFDVNHGISRRGAQWVNCRYATPSGEAAPWNDITPESQSACFRGGS